MVGLSGVMRVGSGKGDHIEIVVSLWFNRPEIAVSVIHAVQVKHVEVRNRIEGSPSPSSRDGPKLTFTTLTGGRMELQAKPSSGTV